MILVPVAMTTGLPAKTAHIKNGDHLSEIDRLATVRYPRGVIVNSSGPISALCGDRPFFRSELVTKP